MTRSALLMLAILVLGILPSSSLKASPISQYPPTAPSHCPSPPTPLPSQLHAMQAAIWLEVRNTIFYPRIGGNFFIFNARQPTLVLKAGWTSELPTPWLESLRARSRHQLFSLLQPPGALKGTRMEDHQSLVGDIIGSVEDSLNGEATVSLTALPLPAPGLTPRTISVFLNLFLRSAPKALVV